MPKKGGLELTDILTWIFEHREDEKAMTEISQLAYPFSSKYKARFGPRDDSNVHVSF